MTVALSGRPDSCSIDCSSGTGDTTTQHFCVCEAAAEAARCARGGLLPMPGTAHEDEAATAAEATEAASTAFERAGIQEAQ